MSLECASPLLSIIGLLKGLSTGYTQYTGLIYSALIHAMRNKYE